MTADSTTEVEVGIDMFSALVLVSVAESRVVQCLCNEDLGELSQNCSFTRQVGQSTGSGVCPRV